jgi:two-component system, NarL family, nitrate/nitrite response regulator NarL
LLSVIIVGDIRLVREGVAQLLRSDGRVSVTGCVDTVDEAVALLDNAGRSVVLLDMASRDSFEAVRRLREAAAAVPVVALGVAEVDMEIVSCAEAGLASYVPRSASIEDLVRCVHGAADGEVHCPPRLVGLLFRRLAELAPAAAADPAARVELTRRERQVFDLLSEGRSNKEIARALGIELSTVKNHVHRVLRKMNVERRVQVATHGVALPRRVRAASSTSAA